MSCIAAIPTTYSGVRFRSRLEARWAAFFDLVGIKWEYEPLDLAGYIPDFVINHLVVLSSGEQTTARRVVEVKPCLDVEELYEAVPKIISSGWTGRASIVGSVQWPSSGGRYQFGIQSSSRTEWKSWVGWNAEFDPTLKWREAGNRVQWKGRT